MMKQILFLAMFGTLIFTACQKDNVTDAESYTSEYVTELETRERIGGKGCFELVWPVTLNFPDSTTQEVASIDEMKAAVKAWKTANPDVQGKPSIAFPYEVITKEGQTVTINSREDLLALNKDCRPKHGSGHGKSCFTIQFPISIVYPDGTVSSYENPRAMQKALREWKKANKDSTERPIFQFPINVTLKDGTTRTINNKEELEALKEECRG